ncbi:phage portal protein [Vibrio cholerae]
MFITKSQDFFGGSAALKNFISGSGATVTYDTALQDPTVKACVRVIAQTISTLPLKLYKQQTSGIGKEWIEDNQSLMSYVLTAKPNPRQTSPEFIEQMIVQLAVFSEYYAIVHRSPNGKILKITPFNSPKQVSVREAGEGLIYDCVTNEGKSVTLTSEEIFCLKDLSLNTFQAMDKINLAKSSIGLSLSATHNAEDYYRKGSRAGGFIKVQGKLSDEAYSRLAKQVNDNYAGTENAHRIGILEGDASFVENAYSLKNAQVLESRNASVREIAALFGVPISLLGISDPNMKDVETINSFFYRSCLQSIITKIEARFRLLVPRGYALKFDMSEYLKGDVKTQAEVIETLFTRGLISRTEARNRLGMQADTKKNIYVVSSNNLVFGELEDFTATQEIPTTETDLETQE